MFSGLEPDSSEIHGDEVNDETFGASKDDIQAAAFDGGHSEEGELEMFDFAHFVGDPTVALSQELDFDNADADELSSLQESEEPFANGPPHMKQTPVIPGMSVVGELERMMGSTEEHCGNLPRIPLPQLAHPLPGHPMPLLPQMEDPSLWGASFSHPPPAGPSSEQQDMLRKLLHGMQQTPSQSTVADVRGVVNVSDLENSWLAANPQATSSSPREAQNQGTAAEHVLRLQGALRQQLMAMQSLGVAGAPSPAHPAVPVPSKSAEQALLVNLLQQLQIHSTPKGEDAEAAKVPSTVPHAPQSIPGWSQPAPHPPPAQGLPSPSSMTEAQLLNAQHQPPPSAPPPPQQHPPQPQANVMSQEMHNQICRKFVEDYRLHFLRMGEMLLRGVTDVDKFKKDVAMFHNFAIQRGASLGVPSVLLETEFRKLYQSLGEAYAQRRQQRQQQQPVIRPQQPSQPAEQNVNPLLLQLRWLLQQQQQKIAQAQASAGGNPQSVPPPDPMIGVLMKVLEQQQQQLAANNMANRASLAASHLGQHPSGQVTYHNTMPEWMEEDSDSPLLHAMRQRGENGNWINQGEIEWLKRIMTKQISSDNPFRQDYYFTKCTLSRMMREYDQEVRRAQQQDPSGASVRSMTHPLTYLTSPITADELMTGQDVIAASVSGNVDLGPYRPPTDRIENNLGRFTVSSCYTPRPLVDLSLDSSTSPTSDGYDYKPTTMAIWRETEEEDHETVCTDKEADDSPSLPVSHKRLLMKIENLYTLVLQLEELSITLQKLVAQTPFRGVIEQCRKKTVEQIRNALSAPSYGCRSMLAVKKGCDLITRFAAFLENEELKELIVFLLTVLCERTTKEEQKDVAVQNAAFLLPIANVFERLDSKSSYHILQHCRTNLPHFSTHSVAYTLLYRVLERFVSLHRNDQQVLSDVAQLWVSALVKAAPSGPGRVLGDFSAVWSLISNYVKPEQRSTLQPVQIARNDVSKDNCEDANKGQEPARPGNE